MNLYNDILNIPESMIQDNDNNINKVLSSDNSTDIVKLNRAIEIVNQFHSYFHFEQSYVYIICAYIFRELNDTNNASAYIDKAIFQDHTNEIALSFQKSKLEDILSYEKAIKFEDVFLDFAIGKHASNKSIQNLDSSMILALGGDYERAMNLSYNLNYKSHRLEILKSLIFVWQKEFSEALRNILAAAKMLENNHKDYHKYASNIYKMRAEIFQKLGKPELAHNDIIKSQDLVA